MKIGGRVYTANSMKVDTLSLRRGKLKPGMECPVGKRCYGQLQLTLDVLKVIRTVVNRKVVNIQRLG